MRIFAITFTSLNQHEIRVPSWVDKYRTGSNCVSSQAETGSTQGLLLPVDNQAHDTILRLLSLHSGIKAA